MFAKRDEEGRTLFCYRKNELPNPSAFHCKPHPLDVGDAVRELNTYETTQNATNITIARFGK